MDEPSVRGGLAISGIYDLEPIRHCYLNEKLGLREEDIDTLSPLRRMQTSLAPMMLACGGAELPELQRQSADYAAARESAGLPVRLQRIDGCNHFTILEELAKPEGVLTGMLLDLIAN
jgi:arylformamidase